MINRTRGRHGKSVTPGRTPALHHAMTETAIIARAQRGDDAAFESLVRRYYVRCWRYARGMLNDPSDADDVAQNVFYRVHRALPNFVDDGRFVSWLFQIVVNECRMANRSRGRRLRRVTSRDHAALAMHADPRTHDIHSMIDLGVAVARLEPRQREVLLLRFGENLELSEIAAVIGIGESAAKMRLKRACDALRAILVPERSNAG